MTRAFSYNSFSAALFPYGHGLQEVGGQPLLMVQGIFTKDGKKSPAFVNRDDAGYKLFRSGLSREDEVIGFFGKETSGGDAAVDLMLEDMREIGFSFKPIFCRHVDVLTQAKLVAARVPYRIFVDYAKQCEEWQHLEDAILGAVARLSRAHQ